MNNSVMEQNSIFQQNSFTDPWFSTQKLYFNEHSINLYDTSDIQKIISYLNIFDNCYFQNNTLSIFNNNILFIEPYTLQFFDEVSNFTITKNNPNDFKEILLENDHYDYLSELGNYNLSQDDYLTIRDFI